MSHSHLPGTLFIISAPSGAGKTSLIHALLTAMPQLTVSISHTTRAPRPGEQNNQHYHFVSEPEFHALLAAGNFLEYAQVFDHFYGTSQQAVTQQLAAGKNVILEIDWQGAQQIRQHFNEAVSIFILPPSLNTLKQRLIHRNQDQAGVIERRLAEARNEISHFAEYDYLIINDTFEQALNELIAATTASLLKTSIQASKHQALIQSLLNK